MFVILIVILVISSNQNKNLAAQKAEIESLVNQKEILMSQINNLNNQLEMNDNKDTSPELPYIQPEFLKAEWDKVILETHDNKVEIDSKPIIEIFRYRFIGIIQTENPYPAGFPIGFTFHIFSGGQKYSFYSLENDFFMNAEMDTFYRSEKDFTQLAKAYLPNPIGDLDENLYSKLYNSGLVTGEKKFPIPVLDSHRIKGIASTFIALEKEEMDSRPIIDDYYEKFTFYYFGDKYYMTLYDEYIHISDERATVDSWFKAPQDAIPSILAVLSAG